MTQYERITGKVFGGNATATGNDPQIAQFGSALANTFVGTTDPATIQSLPAWGQGWIGAVTPDTQFPPLPEMTGAMKVLSHQICGILQQGVSTWDSGTIYYTGNFSSKNGIVYVSLSDLNQGNDPETDTTNWRNYGGADIDLSNLSSQGQNIANWSTNVTNCITEIPQRIKLEVSNGTLILKSGSEVIIPNGLEEDGVTPKFDYVTIESDLTLNVGGVNTTRALMYNSSSGNFEDWYYPNIYSGSGAPSSTQAGSLWYDTTNNQYYTKLGTTWEVTNGWSLPLGICEFDGNEYTLLEVYNGFGYIGSTLWVDKGVKCLLPNGRNEDGTVKNIECTIDKVRILSTGAYTSVGMVVCITQNALTLQATYFEQEETPSNTYSIWYNPKTNKTYQSGATTTFNELPMCIYARIDRNAGKFGNLKPKSVFRALDYNDKAQISSWAMPSNKYIDLTLGASGTEYTAPANGWVYIDKTSSASGQSVEIFAFDVNGIRINSEFGRISSSTNIGCAALIPVQKGWKFMVNYNLGGSTSFFRFIYAQGEV